MASGGLPALARLTVRVGDGSGAAAAQVRSRVAPAFEAVAGSLRHIWLECTSNDAEVGHELGVAVGKLRRLKDLTLELSHDGRVYHAVAQGLAASGGELSLPLLWRVRVTPVVRANPDLLASLLLPSVRVFASLHTDLSALEDYLEEDTQGALLMACALRQAGYKHTWVVECPDQMVDVIRAIRGVTGVISLDGIFG
jgi:hypothetical protein